MKKVIAFLMVLLVSATNIQAQKTAVVDAEGILQQMPAYEQAQNQLNSVVENWNREVQQRYQNIDDAYRAFQAEKVLLSESERIQREEEIVQMERDTRDFQKSKFGADGELQSKREELVRPIQDEVYAAIEQVAAKQKIDIILDRSGGSTILFVTPQYDITEDVLRQLGLR